MQYIRVSFGKRKSKKNPSNPIDNFDTTLYDYICERNGIENGDMVVVECDQGKFFDRFQDEGVSVAFVVETNVSESSICYNINNLKHVICKVQNDDVLEYELSKVKERSIIEYKEYTLESLLVKVEQLKKQGNTADQIITYFENFQKIFKEEIDKYVLQNKYTNSYELQQKIIAAKAAVMQIFLLIQAIKTEAA